MAFRKSRSNPPPYVTPSREWTVNLNDDRAARPVTNDETDEWFESAQQRDFIIVFRQIDAMLDILANEGWGLRTRMIRKQLRWLRSHAASRGLEWGRYDEHGIARIR